MSCPPNRGNCCKQAPLNLCIRPSKAKSDPLATRRASRKTPVLSSLSTEASSLRNPFSQLASQESQPKSRPLMRPRPRSALQSLGAGSGGPAVAMGPHGLSPPKRRWPPGAAGPPARHFRTTRGPGSARAHLPYPCPPSSRRPMMESRLSFSLSDMAAPPLRPTSSGPSPASRPLAASFRPGSPSALTSPPPARRPASSVGRPALLSSA